MKKQPPKIPDLTKAGEGDFIARLHLAPSDALWGAADLLWAVYIARPQSFQEIDRLLSGIPAEAKKRGLAGDAHGAALAHIVDAFLLDRLDIPEDVRRLHAAGYIAGIERAQEGEGVDHRIEAAKTLFYGAIRRKGDAR